MHKKQTGKMVQDEKTKLFIKQFSEFRALFNKTDKRGFKFGERHLQPLMNDNKKKVDFDRHYIFHTAWAARKLAEIKPKKHLDISSNLFFISIASAFVPIEFYDYHSTSRLEIDDNLKTGTEDLNKLTFADNSVESISSMHVVEHIGLGRYGDKLDPDGDLKAISELKRVVRPEGHLLFVVPIGEPVILFNAHRIYSHKQILKLFNEFKLQELVLIPDNFEDGNLIKNPPESLLLKQKYGCGCFWFIKEKK